MGGHYACTGSNEPAFDPRSVKIGDVLYTIFWSNGEFGEEPEILTGTVAKIEQVGMQRFGDQVEETWCLGFGNEVIGDRHFKINAFVSSYTPFFWTSKEDVEAAARASMTRDVGFLQEEIDELEKKIAGTRLLIASPLTYRDSEYD